MSIPSLIVLQQGGGLLPEVEAFEDFHEQHGPTGGWHPDDHAEFGSILKACKGDYSHATLMCYDQMIGFKRADIIAHARYEATKSGVRDTTVEHWMGIGYSTGTCFCQTSDKRSIQYLVRRT